MKDEDMGVVDGRNGISGSSSSSNTAQQPQALRGTKTAGRHFRRVIAVIVILLLYRTFSSIVLDPSTQQAILSLQSSVVGNLSSYSWTGELATFGTNNTNNSTTLPVIVSSFARIDQQQQQQQQQRTTIFSQHLVVNESLKTIAHLPHRPDRRIAFIHIGKCGGTSLERVLYRRDCWRNSKYWRTGPKEKHTACLKFQESAIPPEKHESVLSRHTVHNMHIMLAMKQDLSTFNTLLYAIRHPVQRVVSAYYFLHYDNSQQSVFARGQDPIKDQFYKDCFPTLPELEQALVDNTANAIDNTPPPPSFLARTNKTIDSWEQCQQLAMQVLLDGLSSKQVNIHIAYGYQFYYERCGNHKDRDIFVIRMEHLWKDMEHLDIALGGKGTFPKRLHAFKNAQKKTPIRQTNLWCCLLYEEFVIYQDILLAAINLSPYQKQVTLLSLYQSCNIQSYSNQTATLSYKNDPTNNNTTLHFPILSWKDWQEQECPQWRYQPNVTWQHVDFVKKKLHPVLYQSSSTTKSSGSGSGSGSRTSSSIQQHSKPKHSKSTMPKRNQIQKRNQMQKRNQTHI